MLGKLEMKNKIKGFVLIELIISVFILSIISFGIYRSILSLQNIHKNQIIKKELLNTAKNVIESEISGITFIEKDSKFTINVAKEKHSANLEKLTVKVYSEVIDDEAELFVYYEKKD